MQTHKSLFRWVACLHSRDQLQVIRWRGYWQTSKDHNKYLLPAGFQSGHGYTHAQRSVRRAQTTLRSVIKDQIAFRD